MANTKYLLPSSCGQEIPVDILKQAKRFNVPATSQVPTLKDLGNHRAPLDASPRKATWGLRPQLPWWGRRHYDRSPVGQLPRRQPSAILDITTVSLHAWHIWQDLRLVCASAEYRMFNAMVAAYWRLSVVSVIAAAGLLTMASSCSSPAKRRNAQVHTCFPKHKRGFTTGCRTVRRKKEQGKWERKKVDVC